MKKPSAFVPERCQLVTDFGSRDFTPPEMVRFGRVGARLPDDTAAGNLRFGGLHDEVRGPA